MLYIFRLYVSIFLIISPDYSVCKYDNIVPNRILIFNYQTPGQRLPHPYKIFRYILSASIIQENENMLLLRCIPVLK